LEAMSAAHRAHTFLSGAGEFPTISGSQLGAHPSAIEYYKTGVPWTYRDLPPWLASMLEEYSTLGLALLVIGAIILMIGPISDMIGGLLETIALGMIRRSSRIAEAGKLTSEDLRRLDRADRLLRWVDSRHEARDVIASLRTAATT